MINLEQMEEHFQTAKQHVYNIKNNTPKNDADTLCHWILNTPYNLNELFCDHREQKSLTSINSLSLLCFLISHALIDDGEIQFVEINKIPCIIFAEEHQFHNKEDYLKFIIEIYKKTHGKEIEQIKIIKNNVNTFIKKYEKTKDNQLKEMFLSEAVVWGKEKAVKEFEKYFNFDSNWINEAPQ